MRRDRLHTQGQKGRHLSGPVLRDNRETISAIPPYCALWGFLVSQHGQLGAITPSPFSEHFPLGEHVKWRCDTPPQKGYLSDTCAIPYENKANGCDTPLCDTISKGYCVIGGGVSHWAARDDVTTLSAKNCHVLGCDCVGQLQNGKAPTARK